MNKLDYEIIKNDKIVKLGINNYNNSELKKIIKTHLDLNEENPDSEIPRLIISDFNSRNEILNIQRNGTGKFYRICFRSKKEMNGLLLERVIPAYINPKITETHGKNLIKILNIILEDDKLKEHMVELKQSKKKYNAAGGVFYDYLQSN